MTALELDAGKLAESMVAFEEALRIHRDLVNRLNVYPVPDGDTGTNMSLTVEAVTGEIAKLENGATALEMEAVCRAISHGSLMGARGNSGIILCQILRGLAGVFAEHDLIRAAEMAAGLEAANTAAREGVMRPVEGTILTVAAAAATAAAKAAADGAELGPALDSARDAAVEALHSTPELLPVLAAAKVVDAGGAGLVLLFDALLHVADDRPLPPDLPLPEAVREAIGGAAGRATGEAAQTTTGPIRPAGEPAGVVDGLRYEVMYLLDAPDAAIPAFKEVWAGLGDSIVVVGGDGLWNCHIHTADIGPAIEAALDAGRPRDIRVTDLAEQVEEEMWVRSAEAGGEPPAVDGEAKPAPVTSVVVVATGDGIRRIFHSLGVHQVVAGGQSMNPSTAQILDMVEAAPSDQVVILPNNSNIYPVAAQVGSLTSKNVRVVRTAGIQEGFAALIEYDPEADADTNAEAMYAAAERVVAGEVTRAVRASDSAAGPIEAGDWIGLSRDGIESVAKSPGEAATQLLDKLVGEEHELVTLIEGNGSSTGETRLITEWLRAERPHVEVERHHGGQPLYPYLLSVE